jgi:hypothetical protein
MIQIVQFISDSWHLWLLAIGTVGLGGLYIYYSERNSSRKADRQAARIGALIFLGTLILPISLPIAIIAIAGFLLYWIGRGFMRILLDAFAPSRRKDHD